jgi:glycosyltransferase involved in cell wall biosynthesis
MSLNIIIPVYNTSIYLEKCFNSLIIDDLKYINEINAQVLFVNDGSTDNSLQIINKIKEKYSFVKVIDQKNSGLSTVRNNAIKKTDSDFFLFLDSDDRLNIKEIAGLYKKAQSNKLDLIYYGLEYFDENNVKTGVMAPQPVPFNKVLEGTTVLLSNYYPSSACLCLYNTEFIKKNELFFFPKITQQDVEYSIRLLIKAKKVYFTKSIAYEYFRRTDSITMSKDEKKVKKYLSDMIIVASQIKKNIKDSSLDTEMTECVEKNYNSVVWGLIWRFITKRNEVDYEFKVNSLLELKNKKLYPIKGTQGSTFQKILSLLFNKEWLLKIYLKL